MLFTLWRDTTSELWIPVQFFYIVISVYHLLALFTFLQTITFYHSIRLILCLQQIGEIDNLIISWDKVLVTRVNSTNVLDEGLRIGEIGRRMNSKVKLVEIGVKRK
jgi:hypothetical protein